MANGIVQAFALLEERGDEISHPLVVRLDGNNAEEGRRILTEAALPLLEQVDTMDGAARPRRRAGRASNGTRGYRHGHLADREHARSSSRA